MDKRHRFLLRLTVPIGLMLAAATLRTPAQLSDLDLLPPSRAFRLEVSRPQADRVHIRWTIAEGYYLYRQRLRFEAAPAKVLDGFTLPPGTVKLDPFFGETEIYRHRVAFELPLEAAAPALESISLRIVSQGCADVGICFPPEVRNVRLAVGETAAAEAADPFEPTGAEQDKDLFLPPSPRLSAPPPKDLSP